MCDTFVVLPQKTNNNSVIFGKNSDRDPNEPHQVELVDAKSHPDGTMVACTYRSIPQVVYTNQVLLFKPIWIWGAEMGLNEHGVVIGNEAVFSKIKAGAEPGLIGMDYLRLGLERASTAYEALEVITALLEKYGQSGNCGFNHKMVYHNAFIIADSKEAWVLETVDKHWIAKKVDDVGAISNAYSIGETWDLKSKQLFQFAQENRLWKTKEPFNFAKIFSDTLFTRFGEGNKRQSCAISQLSSHDVVEIKNAMDVLRFHPDSKNYHISDGIWGNDICMHAGFGPIRASQTTGSLVAAINKCHMEVWFTGASSPCLSMYLPYQFGYKHPILTQKPGNFYETKSYWWQREYVNRLALFSAPKDLSAYREELFKNEKMIMDAFALTDKKETSEKKQDLINEAYKKSILLNEKWEKIFKQSSTFSNKNLFHQLAWKNFNKQAKLDII